MSRRPVGRRQPPAPLHGVVFAFFGRARLLGLVDVPEHRRRRAFEHAGQRFAPGARQAELAERERARIRAEEEARAQYRKIAERRVFPAVDVNLSSTRKDELLLSPEEFSIVHKLRRVLSGLDSHQAIDLLISQLKKTRNNIQFLMQVQKNTPGAMNDDD